jgi:hypothetical protein
MGLTLEQYMAGQRAPTVPMAPSNASALTSNGHKRRRSSDQVCQFILQPTLLRLACCVRSSEIEYSFSPLYDLSTTRS